ncbi:hypothetical protein PanWU01x14_367630, partial [Parasponia andersonii]
MLRLIFNLQKPFLVGISPTSSTSSSFNEYDHYNHNQIYSSEVPWQFFGFPPTLDRRKERSSCRPRAPLTGEGSSCYAEDPPPLASRRHRLVHWKTSIKAVGAVLVFSSPATIPVIIRPLTGLVGFVSSPGSSSSGEKLTFRKRTIEGLELVIDPPSDRQRYLDNSMAWYRYSGE